MEFYNLSGKELEIANIQKKSYNGILNLALNAKRKSIVS